MGMFIINRVIIHRFSSWSEDIRYKLLVVKSKTRMSRAGVHFGPLNLSSCVFIINVCVCVYGPERTLDAAITVPVPTFWFYSQLTPACQTAILWTLCVPLPTSDPRLFVPLHSATNTAGLLRSNLFTSIHSGTLSIIFTTLYYYRWGTWETEIFMYT